MNDKARKLATLKARKAEIIRMLGQERLRAEQTGDWAAYHTLAAEKRGINAALLRISARMS